MNKVLHKVNIQQALPEDWYFPYIGQDIHVVAVNDPYWKRSDNYVISEAEMKRLKILRRHIKKNDALLLKPFPLPPKKVKGYSEQEVQVLLHKLINHNFGFTLDDLSPQELDEWWEKNKK